MTLIQRTTIGTVCILLFAMAVLFAFGFLYLLVQGSTSQAAFCFVTSGLLAVMVQRGVDLLLESYIRQ